MTAYNTDVTEYRALREAQVDEVMNHALQGSDWRVAIVGMDMNDFPEESVYQKFLDHGFVDAYNPHQKYFFTKYNCREMFDSDTLDLAMSILKPGLLTATLSSPMTHCMIQ